VSALITIILPVFLVLGFGYFTVWRGFFSDSAADSLMQFSQKFAIPLLLFRAISRLDLSHGYNAGLMISYYSGSVAAFAIGMLGARLLFHRAWDESVAIGFSALFTNSVLLGLPIMERAYGPGSLGPNFAIISIHAPFCYFLGISSMEIVRNRQASPLRMLAETLKAMFKNALMLAIIAGFIVNLSGITLAGPIAEALDLVVRAALPTALFALGGILYRYRPDGDLRLVAWVCGLSLFLHPAVAYVLSTAVFALPKGMVHSAVLTAAMAPGVNAFIFSNIYGTGRRIAASAVLSGTLLSVFSVTFWLAVLGV